jgi:predicted RNA binding protein YcfA (HicA-like mRNA interferase family)
VSKKEKLLQKILSGDQDKGVNFDDAELLLLRAGFVHRGGEGSHRVYRHSDGRRMVLAHHGKSVAPAYIRQIRNLLKNEN